MDFASIFLYELKLTGSAVRYVAGFGAEWQLQRMS